MEAEIEHGLEFHLEKQVQAWRHGKWGGHLRKCQGSWRVKGWVPAFTRISKGPRNLSESLWDGWVVWKNLALTKACSPMVKFGAGDLFASAGP